MGLIGLFGASLFDIGHAVDFIAPVTNTSGFDSKVALVTGAGRGIGQATFLALVAAGVNSAVCVDYTEAACEETLQKGQAMVALENSKRIVTLASFGADVGNYDSVLAMAEKVKIAVGAVDILVNNAGITRDRPVTRMSNQDWEEVIRINLSSVFYMCKAFVNDMVKKRSGRIINISSAVGLRGNPGQSNYAASKAGINGFSKSLAKELGIRGVLVNAVAPGFVESKMTAALSETVHKNAVSQIALNRFGTAAEVAAGVVFLASSAASYVTGSILGIDGVLNI